MAKHKKPTNKSDYLAAVGVTNARQHPSAPPQRPRYTPETQVRAPRKGETPVRMGEWVVTFLLTAIPVVGLIMMFVWAFGQSAKASKRSYARANLAIMLVVIILAIIAILIVTFALKIDILAEIKALIPMDA